MPQQQFEDFRLTGGIASEKAVDRLKSQVDATSAHALQQQLEDKKTTQDIEAEKQKPRKEQDKQEPKRKQKQKKNRTKRRKG